MAERMIYQPTEKQAALPATIELPSDEQIKMMARTGRKRPWGLVKRDLALRALRNCRDYTLGLWQGRVDAARGCGYSDERFAEAYNLGYHEGFSRYQSDRHGWQPWQREEFDRLYLADLSQVS